MKGLIQGQTIMIDTHQRGCGIPNNWDDKSQDVHLHKRPKNSQYTYNIRVSLNHDVSVKESHGLDVPPKIKKEVQRAFADTKKREKFVKGLLVILKNYSSIYSDIEKAQSALGQIAKFFELPWDDKKISEFIIESVRGVEYKAIVPDTDGSRYSITMFPSSIKICEV